MYQVMSSRYANQGRCSFQMAVCDDRDVRGRAECNLREYKT